jgi:type II secretory pathway component PulK
MRLSPKSSKRPGVVLLGVLVVTVILALMAYQYSDRMVLEYQSATYSHRATQLRHFADSGVHSAAAMLASPDNIANYLNGNPFDNPERFKNISLPDMEGTGQGGKFTLVAPIDPDHPTSGGLYRPGVTCEAGKININAAMKRDATGAQLFGMLSKLPNMPPELAAAIVDWVDSNYDIYIDGDSGPIGCEDEYYSALSPPSRCKNGPLDSLDELLLVRGMTRELLYGVDLNKNGISDADEANSGSTDRGFSAFLTVHSREANRDATGQPLINLNGDDLTVLSDKLAPLIDPNLLKFIILFRQNGATSSTGTSQSLVASLTAVVQSVTGTSTTTTARVTTTQTTQNSSTQQTTTEPGDLSSYEVDLTKAGSKKFTSLLDLVGSTVTVKSGQKSIVFTSPLLDPTTLGEAMTTLYQLTSLNDDPEIPARINVNTAPREVLMCLDGLTEENVEAIIQARPSWGSDTPSADFQSIVWLVSQAKLSMTTLKSLEKVVTVRSQVFHMQVVGQFESGKGPTARVEAIVDANFGRPRIVYYRDWSELGRTILPE